MTHALPLPGLRPVVRDALGAVLVVSAPLLVVAGVVAGGLAAAALAAALLAHRRLRAAPGWDASGATWVAVTADEIERAAALGHARARWARDPWHLLGGAGAALWLALAGAASLGGILLGLDAALVGSLALAAAAALLPPLCVGGRAAAVPDGLGADLALVREWLADARANPAPGRDAVPELLLAAAGEGLAVPAGARLRIHWRPAPPAFDSAMVERAPDGRPRAAVRLHPGPAAAAVVAGLPAGFSAAAGTDRLLVELPPGPDLPARLRLLLGRLAPAPGASAP